MAVTAYIFGCSSVFEYYDQCSEYKLNRHSFFSAVFQFHTFKSTALCCRIDRMKKDDMIINIPLECTFLTLFRTMRIVAKISI